MPGRAMASIDVSLGAIDLFSTASDLQLHLESHARIASSADEADGILDRLTDTALTCPPKDLWITRGNDFRLTIRINVDLESLGRDQLTRAFAHDLYHEKLFEALQLEIVSMEVACHEDVNVSVITLNLARASVSLSSPMHKLAEGVPFDDVHPPIGIHELEMVSVQLHMHVKSELRTNLWIVDTRTDNNSHRPDDTSNPRRDHASSIESAGSEAEDEDMLFGATDCNDDMLAGADDGNTKVMQQPKRPDDSSLKRAASVAKPLSAMDPPKQLMLELLDAGLRQSIAGSPKRASKPLWSPSYQLAISQRAILTPTITHALVKQVEELENMTSGILLVSEPWFSSHGAAKAEDIFRLRSISACRDDSGVEDDMLLIYDSLAPATGSAERHSAGAELHEMEQEWGVGRATLEPDRTGDEEMLFDDLCSS
ncbi:unnamed protein product [Zymoseptoria tritici ST99CH_3D1]|nr:unnamed protein product [Zymoseptoria tritici ST99CH_3D1]